MRHDSNGVGSTGSVGPVGSYETPPRVTDGDVIADLRSWLGRYICVMHDADLDLLTLWIAHTHLIGDLYTTPRLLVDSPVPGSGKTTLLEHVYHLGYHPVQMASLSSPALLTRMLDDDMRTVLIDEADRSLNPKKDGVEELLAVLNSGYKRGGTRPVLVPTKDGWVAKEMPTFSPVVMAGNDPQLPDDTRSRTLRILLLPDEEGLIEESNWEDIEIDAEMLKQRLEVWTEEVREFVGAARPPLPHGITGRSRERWSPLKRIAAATAGRWPEVVDELALKEQAQLAQDKEDGMARDKPAVMLLKHIYRVWPAEDAFISTKDLIDDLVLEYPESWGDSSTYGKELTSQRMGRMLVKAYSINSMRQGDSARGYFRSAFTPVWRRMGIALPIEPTEPPEPAEPTDEPTECIVCHDRLISVNGSNTHPTCEPMEAEAS